MLPKFSRGQWVWIAIIVIALFLIFAPDAGLTLFIKHAVSWAGGMIQQGTAAIGH